MGGEEVQLHLISTSALAGGEMSVSPSGPSMKWGLRAYCSGSGRVWRRENLRPGFEIQPFQAVASLVPVPTTLIRSRDSSQTESMNMFKHSETSFLYAFVYAFLSLISQGGLSNRIKKMLPGENLSHIFKSIRGLSTRNHTNLSCK